MSKYFSFIDRIGSAPGKIAQLQVIIKQLRLVTKCCVFTCFLEKLWISNETHHYTKTFVKLSWPFCLLSLESVGCDYMNVPCRLIHIHRLIWPFCETNILCFKQMYILHNEHVKTNMKIQLWIILSICK